VLSFRLTNPFRSSGRLLLLTGFLSLSLAGLSACAHYPINLPMNKAKPPAQARSELPNYPERSDELYLIVALSGGGTRASALSYGVLEALSMVEVPAPNDEAASPREQAQHTLLEEIDVMSSVSGGSFTAAYYCLYKDRLFEDFKDRFLYYDVQQKLIWRMLSPFNLIKVLSSWYGRADMAAEYYDEILFEGATFGDLQFRNAPLLFIQATDMVDGNCFGFTPYQFNLICSDLFEYPVSRAVAASSAFPGAFDAIILKNYAEHCDSEEDHWVARALEENDRTSRIFQAASRTQAYLDPESKPYIHLFDGGVCDNLGLRGPLAFPIIRGGIREYLKSVGQPNTRRVVFVIVNAQGKESIEWSRVGRLASITRVLGISSSVLVNSYTYETVELLRSYVREWSSEDAAEAASMPLEFYVIEVTFEALNDEDERRFFSHVPTTLSLPEETVDKLSDAGKRILYESEDFKRLIHDLEAEIHAPLSTKIILEQPAE
jgi:NTE family protein